jgi:hypothetical protein
MFVGIDTYHDRRKFNPSVFAMVCSLNSECTKYFTRTICQTPGQETGDEIIPLFTTALLEYHQVRYGNLIWFNHQEGLNTTFCWKIYLNNKHNHCVFYVSLFLLKPLSFWDTVTILFWYCLVSFPVPANSTFWFLMFPYEYTLTSFVIHRNPIAGLRVLLYSVTGSQMFTSNWFKILNWLNLEHALQVWTQFPN